MSVMCLFFFERSCHHRYLHVLTHSFPTRRSSDLTACEEQRARLVAILMRTRQAILLRRFFMARSARSRRPQPFVAYGQIGLHPRPPPLGQARSPRAQHFPAPPHVAKLLPRPLGVHPGTSQDPTLGPEGGLTVSTWGSP